MIKRTNKFAITAILGSVLVAACSNGSTGTSGSAGGSDADKVVEVAVITPETGTVAYFHDRIKFGLDFALAEKPPKYKLNLTYFDEGGSPDTAVAAVQKVLTASKPKLIIGPVLSNDVLAASTIMKAGEIPQFFGAYLPSLTQGGNDHIFRAVAHDGLNYSDMVTLIKKEGRQKLGIFVPATAYGEGVQKTLTDVATQKGLAVDTSAGLFNPTATDFSGQLLKLKTAGVDSLFFAGTDPDLALVVKQARQLGLTQPIYGAPTMADPPFLQAAGAAAEGIVYISNYVESDPVTKDFTDKFVAKFHTTVTNNAIGAYLTGLILVDVYNRVGPDTSGKALADAIRKTSIDTVFGHIAFDAKGDLVNPKNVFGKITNGSPVIYGTN